jgi:hypothetical protein
VAGSAVRRHILEVGAECVSSACSDLCGGWSAMTIPTAIKFPILGADTVQMVEGNTSGCDSASARTTRRGQRPWHVHTLLAREPGGWGMVEKKTSAWRQRRAALDELRAAVRARQHAEAELAGLYRERAIARARAAERDPNAALN